MRQQVVPVLVSILICAIEAYSNDETTNNEMIDRTVQSPASLGRKNPALGESEKLRSKRMVEAEPRRKTTLEQKAPKTAVKEEKAEELSTAAMNESSTKKPPTENEKGFFEKIRAKLHAILHTLELVSKNLFERITHQSKTSNEAENPVTTVSQEAKISRHQLPPKQDPHNERGTKTHHEAEVDLDEAIEDAEKND
ncbi:hypothetical protein Tcan_03357 [Toxocara canis]|uniref:Secreted protein n=2 Tax=Toxocara canis TaxID=6265 RepID=A0A0B2VX64_TOXCA|nr:hypothetical protein Tcan_03357 [Toxocara canis]VDM40784.1 unnamed protein product [Toxocara canis]